MCCPANIPWGVRTPAGQGWIFHSLVYVLILSPETHSARWTPGIGLRFPPNSFDKGFQEVIREGNTLWPLQTKVISELTTWTAKVLPSQPYALYSASASRWVGFYSSFSNNPTCWVSRLGTCCRVHSKGRQIGSCQGWCSIFQIRSSYTMVPALGCSPQSTLLNHSTGHLYPMPHGGLTSAPWEREWEFSIPSMGFGTKCDEGLVFFTRFPFII